MPLNMCNLGKKSRKKPIPGDVFTFRMIPDDQFRYGRVIRADVQLLAADGSPGSLRGNLVYIYKVASPTKERIPRLRKEELLLAPVFINDTGWHEGYFETVQHHTLKADDILPVHCFYNPGHKTQMYLDCDGKPLPGRYEPCGLYALGSYGSVDLKVSLALGFPEPTEDSPASVARTAKAGSTAKKRRDFEHAVTVYLADIGAGPLDYANFEGRLIDAVNEANAGEWEGHETALDGNYAMIYLHGKDADRLAEVILPIARRAGLPKGSYLLMRYGESGEPEERVEV